MTKLNKDKISRILPFVVLLLLLAAFAMPIAANLSYAEGDGETPIHTLNYEPGKLYWAQGTPDIDENGVCRLSLFDSLTEDENGEHIISPGDASASIVRLTNKSARPVYYKVVLYRISAAGVPIIGDISNIPVSENDHLYTLPDGVSKSNVLRAVSGSLQPTSTKEFTVEWKWDYSTGDDGDVFDTALGNLERADVTLGVWITVTDDVEITPDPPTLNLDTDGDGKPDLNIDTDGDNKPEVNIDTTPNDNINTPNINIDTDGDNKPNINLDLNGDGIADCNFDSDGDGVADSELVSIPVGEGGVATLTDEAIDLILELARDGEVTVKLDNLGEYISGVSIPKDRMQEIIDSGITVDFVMTNVELAADSAALDSMNKQSATSDSDTITLVAKEVGAEDLPPSASTAIGGNHPAIAARIEAYSGSTVIDNVGEGTLKVSIPNYPNSGLSPDTSYYNIYAVQEGVDPIDVPEGFEEGFFTVSTSDFSDFVVVYSGPMPEPPVEPQPPKCTCPFFCLFGDDCRNCVLCWAFIILLALALLCTIFAILWRKFE